MPERNPETVEIELRRDTVEELVDLLKDPGAFNGHNPPMPTDRRKAVADRLEDQITAPDAIALCGLPGAGKTHVSKILSEVYDAPAVSMGDAIREEYETKNGGDYTSEDLGNFAGSWRADAPEEIPEKVVELADRYYRGVGKCKANQSDLIIIDGVRSVTDFEVLNDYFDNFYLLEVKSNFYERLHRVQERGRDGEENFNPVQLAERDMNEIDNLGFRELVDGDYIDITVKNGTGEQMLEINLTNIIMNNLPFQPVSYKPFGSVVIENMAGVVEE